MYQLDFCKYFLCVQGWVSCYIVYLCLYLFFFLSICIAPYFVMSNDTSLRYRFYKYSYLRVAFLLISAQQVKRVSWSTLEMMSVIEFLFPNVNIIQFIIAFLVHIKSWHSVLPFVSCFIPKKSSSQLLLFSFFLWVWGCIVDCVHMWFQEIIYLCFKSFVIFVSP